MTVTLRSTENGAREYEVLAPLVPGVDPARGALFYGRRIAPVELKTGVVIKHAPQSLGTYAELREHYLDEALENASSIHPNLTTVADVIENDDGMYLVLEHIDGTELAALSERLRERKQALSFELSAYVCAEIAKAMNHLHDARDIRGQPLSLLVRDVTPANVLIAANGRVKLANRSLAEALELKRRRSAAQLFAYFAPECIAGEPFSIASDIYGVGVMLHELLVGKRCFEGDSKDEVLEAIVRRGVPIKDLQLAKTPARLISVVERATALVPERRFPTTLDMARALESFVRESTPSADMMSLFAHFLASSKLLGAPADEVKLLPAVIPEPAAELRLIEPAPHVDEPALIESTVDLPSPAAHTATPRPVTTLSDRDRRAIAVRTVRMSDSRPSMPAMPAPEPVLSSSPPAVFSSALAFSPAGEPAPDVKGRTLMWIVAITVMILAVIMLFVHWEESELNKIDEPNERASPDLRERYAPKQ